jgi:epoxyqueuosine reductase QueG
MSEIDKLVRKHTAFKSLTSMLIAEGGYRPTLYTNAAKTDSDRNELTRIANAYDMNQVMADDPRRAHRV